MDMRREDSGEKVANSEFMLHAVRNAKIKVENFRPAEN